MSDKKFMVNSQIGVTKHSISFYNGVSTYDDNSEFWNLRIFKNKRDMKKFIKQLEDKGYKEV